MQSNSTAPTSTDKAAKPRPTHDPDTRPTLSPAAADGKPSKPYPEFPLFPHANGQWCKKIRGTLHYFGLWDDPAGALKKYLDHKDALHAGRTPRPDADSLTVKAMANAFLNHKQAMVVSGELSPRTWRDYKETADLLIDQLGKRRLVADLAPDDFAKIRKAMSKRWGLHRVAKNIQYTRSILKYAIESGMIDIPVRVGPGFKRPSKKNFRLEKAKQEAKLFTAGEIRRMVDAATPPMRAMILLGINCGFGNADCATLTMRAMDIETGWIDFPRPKTGLDRRCPLWPETVAAVKEWLAVRPTPPGKADVDLVFVTVKGNAWMKDSSDNPVSKETAKLLKKLHINGSRNFYALRHTHRTISDETCDQRASGYIMGHVDASMASHYVEMVSDERLKRVAEHVHAWLFGAKEGGAA